MKTILFFTSILIAGNFFSQVNLDSGLIACYALNANGYEPINNLNGSLKSIVPSTDRFNIPNASCYFNGLATTYLELPANPLLKPVEISYSAWIKPLSGFSNAGYIVFTKNSASNLEAYSLSLENFPLGKKIRVTKRNGASLVQIDNVTPLSINTWYHVCFTIDTATVKIYLNGVLENSANAPFGLSYDPLKKVYLGGSNEPGNVYSFSGLIDNARFYNRALNPAEITQLKLADPACVASTMAPVASFSISAPQCPGKNIKFTDLSANSPHAWSWKINGPLVFNSFEVNPEFNFSIAGNYTATQISSNTYGSDTVSLPFTVNPLPPVTAVANKTIVCRTETATLTASGASSYTWSNSQTGPTLAVFVYQVQTYTFSVTGQDVNGCVSTATVMFRANVDCWTDLAVHDAESLSVNFYPNPSSTKINVEMLRGNVEEYELHNCLGVEVVRGAGNNLEVIEIDLREYASGVYFLKLSNKTSSKIIKLLKE